MRCFRSTLSRSCRGFLSAFLLSLFLWQELLVKTALAEECGVTVRLIRASQGDQSDPQLRMSSYLQDVSAQLSPLPFNDYKTVDSLERRVRLRDEAIFRLREAQGKEHVVRVKPYSVARGRVQLTVRWEDPHGDGLVSTSMRVVDGENVMLGTDSVSLDSVAGSRGCTLVGVKIRCGDM